MMHPQPRQPRFECDHPKGTYSHTQTVIQRGAISYADCKLCGVKFEVTKDYEPVVGTHMFRKRPSSNRDRREP